MRRTPALLAVLRCLLGSPEAIWGLGISKETGRPTGTVYPLLARLEREGFVRSEWEFDELRSGPRRRLYELTPEGLQWAHQQFSAGEGHDHRERPRPMGGTS